MNARLPEPALHAAQALEEVSRAWDHDILHQLQDYIRIPAKSPLSLRMAFSMRSSTSSRISSVVMGVSG